MDRSMTIMQNRPVAHHRPAARSYLRRGDELNVEDPSIDFDVVTELHFPDREAYLAWGARLSRPGSGERVVQDEERFLDRARTRAYIVEEHVTSTPPAREEPPV